MKHLKFLLFDDSLEIRLESSCLQFVHHLKQEKFGLFLARISLSSMEISRSRKRADRTSLLVIQTGTPSNRQGLKVQGGHFVQAGSHHVMPQRQSPDQTSKPACKQTSNPRMGDTSIKLSQEVACLRGDTPTKGCRSAHPRRPPPPRPLPGAPKEPDACGCVRCTAEYTECTAVPARLAPYPQHHQIQPEPRVSPVTDRSGIGGRRFWAQARGKGWPVRPAAGSRALYATTCADEGRSRAVAAVGSGAPTLSCYPPVCSARA
jgi:hypothetical protein